MESNQSNCKESNQSILKEISLSSTTTQSLLKFLSIKSVMPSKHLILCHPLLLPPPVFPSIRVFSNESTLHIRWPKYWGFSFSISIFSKYSRVISFRMDWLDLLEVRGILKSLPQHHGLKGSVPWCSDFFMIQISHRFVTTIMMTNSFNSESNYQTLCKELLPFCNGETESGERESRREMNSLSFK